VLSRVSILSIPKASGLSRPNPIPLLQKLTKHSGQHKNIKAHNIDTHRQKEQGGGLFGPHRFSLKVAIPNASLPGIPKWIRQPHATQVLMPINSLEWSLAKGTSSWKHLLDKNLRQTAGSKTQPHVSLMSQSNLIGFLSNPA
jgi:hypothetical protein